MGMNLSGRQRDLLKRYGLAVALATLALGIRGALPVPTGTTVYQLPLAAVVLAGWFGGRGPGFVALLICVAGICTGSYRPRLIPPAARISVGTLLFVFLGLLLTEFSGSRRRVEQASARARNASARSCNSPSTSTGKATRSIALPGRSSPSGSPTRRRGNPKSAKRAGKFRIWNRTKTPGAKHRATLDAHLPFRDFELARPTADGGKRYVSVSGIPVFDAAGRFAVTAALAGTSPSASSPKKNTAHTCGSWNRWTASIARSRQATTSNE